MFYELRRYDVAAGKLPALVDRVGSAVQTNFDPANILPLAQFGRGIDGDAIRSEVLFPCGGAYPHCELQSSTSAQNGFILVPDRAKIRDLAASLFYDPQVKSEGASVEVRSAGARTGVAPATSWARRFSSINGQTRSWSSWRPGRRCAVST